MIFSGYACQFHARDRANDIIQPGAFRDTLGERGLKDIKLLYQHDPTQPLGSWRSLKEDAFGLRVVGELFPGIPRSQEVMTMISEGVVDGLSIGFRSRKSWRDRVSGLRYLTGIELWEISIVTFPMQKNARISDAAAQVSTRSQPPVRGMV